MSDKKVIIIGAGPAGISAGYELTKRGIPVEIFEASPYVGGMSRTFDLWGQKVDLGPHRFFSKEKQINNFFKEVVKDEYTMVNRLTRIYYRNSFFNYPLKIFNVLSNLGIFDAISIMFHYGLQRLNPIKDPKNFEEWVTNRFGKKLFSIFFKSYSEKLWGIPCTKIDASWAAQRIKSLSLVQAVLSAFVGNRGNKHATLVDEFAYPKGGTGVLYEKAANYIKQNGGTIHLSTPVKEILVDDSNTAYGVKLVDDKEITATNVISTMPLTQMVKGLKNTPTEVVEKCNELYFRNTILLYLEVDTQDLFEDNWIYVHSNDVKFGRITNFRNWCPSINGTSETSILCLEYWCFDEDDMWKASEEEISNLAKEEIRKINLIPKSSNILNSKMVHVPKCYPVYETGYQAKVDVISNYLDSINNMLVIGRYGAFKYNNQDHSILMGILAAKKINNEENVDLWEINTDTEYQEGEKVKDVLIS